MSKAPITTTTITLKVQGNTELSEISDLSEIVEALAVELEANYGDDQGSFRVTHPDGTLVDWEVREHRPGMPIDRRQRLVAAYMLMAFDLPAEMGAAAASMLEAASICPGLTTGELPDMGAQAKRRYLEAARDQIDVMLAEIAGGSQ